MQLDHFAELIGLAGLSLRMISGRRLEHAENLIFHMSVAVEDARPGS